MDMESFFLKKLQANAIVAKLDDDCTQFPYTKDSNNKLIIAMDSFIEDIHFRTYSYNRYNTRITKTPQRYITSHQWISYTNLAQKAFLVNISDIISSGALPQYALLAITLPKTLTKQHILEIIDGITHICNSYHIKLIGGDTTKGDKLGFHITIIGKLQGKYLHRKAIKKGDLLAYTSSRNANLGNSLKTLRSLLRYGFTINTLPKNVLESKNPYARFALPALRTKFILKAQKMLHACMDISDGLGNEIQRLESLNALQFHAFKPIKPNIYQSGEEYELLFSFEPKYLCALQRIARVSRINIHVIGQFKRTKAKIWHTIKWH